MNPLFSCNGTPTTEIQACQDIGQCKILNHYTATAKMNLVCDKKAERELIQSSLWAGTAIGVLLLPFLSSVKGRRFAIIFGLCLGVCACLAVYVGIVSSTATAVIVGNVLIGIHCSGSSALTYVISS